MAAPQVEPHRGGEAVARLGLQEAEQRAERELRERLVHVARVPVDAAGPEEQEDRAHAGAGEEARHEAVLLEQRERAEVRPGDAAAAAAHEHERLLADLAVEGLRREPPAGRGGGPRSRQARAWCGEVRDEARDRLAVEAAARRRASAPRATGPPRGTARGSRRGPRPCRPARGRPWCARGSARSGARPRRARRATAGERDDRADERGLRLLEGADALALGVQSFVGGHVGGRAAPDCRRDLRAATEHATLSATTSSNAAAPRSVTRA